MVYPGQKEHPMPGKRPNEPIAPATIPGQPLDPRIPPDEAEADADVDAEFDASEESENEQHARESEKAFDQAITRIPPG
jgi:hypothetical protein